MQSKNKQLGRVVRSGRKRLGLKQTELAKLINFSNVYISDIEQGRRRGSQAIILEIAKVLTLDRRYLLYLAGYFPDLVDDYYSVEDFNRKMQAFESA